MEATFGRLGSERNEDNRSIKSYFILKQPKKAISDRGYHGISVYCTNKLKSKSLIDGKARLDLHCHYSGALPGKPLCPTILEMGTVGHTCTYKVRWKPLSDGWFLESPRV